MDCCLDKGTILNAVYEITDILGMGGYGITYKVIDRNTDRILAIKEYFPAHMVCRDTQSDDVVSHLRCNTGRILRDFLRKHAIWQGLTIIPI